MNIAKEYNVEIGLTPSDIEAIVNGEMSTLHFLPTDDTDYEEDEDEEEQPTPEEKEKQSRSRIGMIIGIIMFILILSALIGAIVLMQKNNKINPRELINY